MSLMRPETPSRASSGDTLFLGSSPCSAIPVGLAKELKVKEEAKKDFQFLCLSIVFEEHKIIFYLEYDNI